MLTVRNLSVSFDELRVLDGLSFDVKEGEVVSILGPSGCGKTTLLRCVAGLLKPSSGKIGLAVVEPGQVAVSLAFQRPVLLEWLTVGENLQLPHGLAGRPCGEETIMAWLQAFKLESFVDYYPRQISVGMAQRVCLARALSENARLLLLDETLSALDEITRRDVCTDLSATLVGRSAIFVTHSIHDAVFLGHRVITLSRQPTRIIGDTLIDLPTPRTQDLWLAPELAPYLSVLRTQLVEYQ
jgi:NitT/TauT family transport system ATP-binding protein